MNATATPLTGPARLGDTALPGWRRGVFAATIVWALAYGGWRSWKALGGEASGFTARADLLLFPGWWPVVLCCAAALVVLALRSAAGSPWWAVTGWVVASCLVLASALLLLDVVGLVLPGVGVTVDLAGLVSRAACLAGGLLVGAYTLSYQRHWRGACLACGRSLAEAGSAAEQTTRGRTPRWAWLAAGLAITGCLVRLAAQLAIGLDGQLLGGSPAAVLFEGGFLLVGTVLPLALVCRWGRVLPGWLPVLGGRRVPRRLVMVPALGLGVGMTAYFGVTMIMIVVQTITGIWSDTGSLPLWFSWIAVPAYLVWGLGLAIGGVSYARATRPRCRHCDERSLTA